MLLTQKQKEFAFLVPIDSIYCEDVVSADKMYSMFDSHDFFIKEYTDNHMLYRKLVIVPKTQIEGEINEQV